MDVQVEVDVDVDGGCWMVEVNAKCSTNTRECDVKIMQQSSAAQYEAGGRRGTATATANPLGQAKSDAQRSVLPLKFFFPCFKKKITVLSSKKSETYE